MIVLEDQIRLPHRAEDLALMTASHAQMDPTPDLVAYDRIRDLSAALGHKELWGLAVDNPVDDLAKFKEMAVDGTFSNIQALLERLHRGFEQPADTSFGAFAEAVQALRGELAIMTEQINVLVMESANSSDAACADGTGTRHRSRPDTARRYCRS